VTSKTKKLPRGSIFLAQVNQKMKIIIPMAGKGTRLRPHTHSKPKPLLHVAGKTLLQHIIDKCMEIEFSEIIFITGHLKENIESFVKEKYSFPFRFIEQKGMNGTACAIDLAREFVDEDVLIIYADTIFETDMGMIQKVQKDENIDGLIWAQEVEDYQRFGVMVVDKDNFLVKIVEKPKEPVSKLANIGVYYIKNFELMFAGIQHLYDNNIKLGAEYYLVDAFTYMIQHGSKILVAKVDGWYDCGAFGTLLDTNATLLKKYHAQRSVVKYSTVIEPSFIDKNVVVENSIIGPNVSIAEGAVIRNSVIRNSIVDENALVENIVLTDSTIGSNTKLRSKSKKLHIGDSSEMDYE
jgi:glucose-1-phosphate thymidylyltransferase